MNAFDSQPTPQFGKAEYAGDPGTDRCAACSQPILNEYYRVNGGMVCPTCVSNVQSTLPKDTHGAFMRAVLFGCGTPVAKRS